LYNYSIMPTSIAQSRQQLAALIAAAQTSPQVITKHNAPVAVLVSHDYFKRSEASIQSASHSIYSQLLALREVYAPTDSAGLEISDNAAHHIERTRQTAWSRGNPFVEPD
jgi:prevent-host-death family protein